MMDSEGITWECPKCKGEVEVSDEEDSNEGVEKFPLQVWPCAALIDLLACCILLPRHPCACCVEQKVYMLALPGL